MDALLFAARAALALVFVAAAIGKLLDRPGSVTALAGFGVPERWTGAGALLLPLVELAIAAALLSQSLAQIGAIAALLLLAAFVAGIANALRRGRTPDCHCFGQLHSRPAGRGTIVRNAALMVPAALVAIGGSGDVLSTDRDAETALVAASALAAALAIAIVVLMRENRLLRLGFRPTGPEPLEIGTEAPEIPLRDVEGTTLNVADVVDPELPTVLVFVQPACAACKTLVPRLERWRESLAEAVRLVIISGPAARGGPTTSEAAAAPQTLWDTDNLALETYRLSGSPSAVQINPDRTIASAPATGNQAIEVLIRVAQRRHRMARATPALA